MSLFVEAAASQSNTDGECLQDFIVINGKKPRKALSFEISHMSSVLSRWDGHLPAERKPPDRGQILRGLSEHRERSDTEHSDLR